MSNNYGFGTLTVRAQHCILGRKLVVKYGNGTVKINGSIIGKYDENGEVFNLSSERIGRSSDDRYHDMYLFGRGSCMDCGRARGNDINGVVENEHHDIIAEYTGSDVGAAAATICAMYNGFLGTSYKSFCQK